MQQRGRQIQQAQARQMLGGLPTQPAPNMRFAASGGLIGYQNGGDIMGPPEPNLYQRMGQGLKNYGTNAQESMDMLRAAKAGVGVPYEKRSAAIQQVRDEIEAQKQNRDPNFIQRMGQKLMDAGLNVEESKSLLKKFYNTFGKTYEEMSNGMAMGGQVKGYAGPDGSDVELDEDLIAAMLAENAQVTGYTGPSSAERRAALADEDARRAQEREARRAEQRARQELANRGLTGPQINEVLSRRLDAVEPGGIAELKQPQFDTRSPQTGPFPTRLTATEFMPEGSSVTGGAGNTSLSEAEKPVSEATAYDYLTDPNLYVPTEVEQRDGDILRFAREQIGRDPEAEALAAGERLRELIGAEDLIKRREEATSKLEAQRASRFSPEMERKRMLRQGLAGLAEKGLGGFGAGYTAEEERIAGEKLSAAEASVADMDKLIGDLRELGLNQFEAEKQARNMVEEGINQGMDTAQAVLASRRQAADAAANRATQERGQDITREVGLAQVSKATDFMNEINIRVDALQEANPSLSDIDARQQALEERIEAQARAQLLANNIRTDTLELEKLTAAYRMAASRLANNPLAMTDPEAYRKAFDEEVRQITAQLMAPSASTTAEFQEGATARDAQGNRIVYRNGNWEPI
jgi:hypothetical protein